MNLANKLTLSRIFCIPVFLVLLLPESFGLPASLNPVCRILALLLFVAAALTDYYDGMLARRHGWITNFGQLFDPLADKMIVATAFIAMIQIELIPGRVIFPAWMVALILCREFLITGLRTLAMSQGRVLAADRWGKNKTISQMVTIIAALVFVALRDTLLATGHWQANFVEGPGLGHGLVLLLRALMWVCVALTIFSGALYLKKNWGLMREDLG